MADPMNEETERPVSLGGEVKALGDNRIGGFLVRFTSPDEPDLEGDYFDASTYFGEVKSVPLFYAHGYDPEIGIGRIGVGQVEVKDAGLWYVAQLEMSEEYMQAIMKLVAAGKIGFSSGAVPNLVQREKKGGAWHIKQWIIGEGSLTPTPADPHTIRTVTSIKSLLAGLEAAAKDETAQETVGASVVAVPEPEPMTAEKAVPAVIEPQPQTKQADSSVPLKSIEKPTMDEEKQVVSQAVPEIDYDKLAAKMVAAQEAAAKARTPNPAPPEFERPNASVSEMSDLWKYDNYDTTDLGIALEGINAFKSLDGRRRWRGGDPVNLTAALGVRILDDYERRAAKFPDGWRAMKSAGLPMAQKDFFHAAKANELHYSTQSGAADQWVALSYSSELWDQIRLGSPVVPKVPSVIVPEGAESVTIPTKTGSVTYYLVSQAVSQDANPGLAAETFTSSKLTAGQKVLGVSKLGAAAVYSGEMVEDAWLPFVSVIRQDMVDEGAEVLESAIIDGDTATGASANINDIAGTPGGTEYWLAFDGFRKSCLVTTTANSRDGGAITVEDFLETVKLMGLAGRNAIDRTKVSFILPVPTHYKCLELSEIKTRDVFTQSTIENGFLTNIFGYNVIVSGNMHKPSTDATYGLKANSAGKIDQDTASNNTTGSILAVRWDQWRLGYKRVLRFEAERHALSDSTSLVASMRVGLAQRDTEASAISYNLTL